MGPALVQAAKTGTLDPATWTPAEQAAAALEFDQALAAIGQHADAYPVLLADVTDADLHEEIDMFREKTTRGAFIVNTANCFPSGENALRVSCDFRAPVGVRVQV